ncbi:MAG TPA: hypothetical protein DCS28_02345, partial [Candidatus Moranbacteria bacterium]|nr:hypothetical protein [Candidatus Moranbacteria bacterium]
GWFIFKWTKELAGILGGLFALTLYAFDPNILGHNHFVTTDIGIAGFMMISFYYFLRFVKEPIWKNVAIGGFFLAIVQLTKFSSILLFPIFGLAAIIYPLVKKIPAEQKSAFLFKLKNLGGYLGKSVVAFAISLAIVWIFYGLNFYKTPELKMAETINFYFNPNDIANVKNIYTNHALLTLNNNSFTRPLSEYFLGIAMVFKRVAGGNGAYFMEQVSSAAFPAYFPTVFALKEPLILLFFMLSAIAIALRNNIKAFVNRFKNSAKKSLWLVDLQDYIRHHIKVLSMLSFIILYSYISITGNLNIGFRHLFPILPFAYILTAKIIIDFCQKKNNYSHKFTFLSATFILSALLIINAVASYPYYMSYFNPIAGGPKNGYKYATDSNADWGQDLKRLQKFIGDYNNCFGQNLYDGCSFQFDCIKSKKTVLWSSCEKFDKITEKTKQSSIDKIRVDYFGGADIKYYIQDKYIKWWDAKRPIEPGWYAISTNFLQGSIYDTTKKDSNSYRWLKNIQPVYQVGTSIFIYYVSEADLKKLN